jgi:hypothetical protein
MERPLQDLWRKFVEIIADHRRISIPLERNEFFMRSLS